MAALIKSAPPNVKIIPNPTEEQKVELFSKASVYLHTYMKEHYGIAVAEAIYFGCVPVVPKFGGPWIDITNSGEFGLGYGDYAEASQKVAEALATRSYERERIYRSRERFEFGKFESALLKYIEDVKDRDSVLI